METTFIGNKNVLAIEYFPLAKRNHEQGILRLWIGGFGIGRPNDTDFFFVLVNGLECILQSSTSFPEFKDADTLSIINQVLDEENPNLESYDKTICQMGEPFDEYFFRSFKHNGKINLIVALEKSDQEHAKQFNFIQVSFTEQYLENLIQDFKNSLLAYNPNLQL